MQGVDYYELPEIMRFYQHPSSCIETAYADIGEGTKVWAWTHICRGARIGKNCNIAEGVYIGPNVVIGDNCKIQNHAIIYEGVTIEDEVFIGPNVITTNDCFPRAVGEWKDRFTETKICKGASICANVTILCGVVIGENSMIGAGSVVTQNVKPGWIAYGNPLHHVRQVTDFVEKCLPLPT